MFTENEAAALFLYTLEQTDLVQPESVPDFVEGFLYGLATACAAPEWGATIAQLRLCIPVTCSDPLCDKNHEETMTAYLREIARHCPINQYTKELP